ncbi:uncharacterized protein LOC135397508 [Ornithodoros turicata]|uniref:uncharacterized protein LOC135397508 n=1 Tax=Ornithodoros turicata TaxID=34597 RepID=UPI003138DEF1
MATGPPSATGPLPGPPGHFPPVQQVPGPQQQNVAVPAIAAPLLPPPQVSAVAIKLPTFWAADPVVWFGQAEAQFALRLISDQLTKFYHVVAALSPTDASEVRDLVASPPTQSPYDVLKTELIRRTSMSEQKRFQRLLTQEELGDRAPSQLLRRMRQLLGDRPDSAVIDDSLLRQLFLQRLPPNVCMVLAAAGTMSLNDLANLADKIMEMAPPQIAAVASHPPSPPTATGSSSPQAVDLSQLVEQISNLQLEVAALRHCSPSPSSRRSRFAHRRSPSPAGICWYHRRFRTKARNCTPPCTFQGNSRASH